MVVTATNQIKQARSGHGVGQFRVVIQGNVVAAYMKIGLLAVMMQVVVNSGAARGNQVLVAGIVPVDEMYRALKAVEVFEHEGRDQVAAVEHNFCAFTVGQMHSPVQVGYMIMTVRENGYAHRCGAERTARAR